MKTGIYITIKKKKNNLEKLLHQWIPNNLNPE